MTISEHDTLDLDVEAYQITLQGGHFADDGEEMWALEISDPDNDNAFIASSEVRSLEAVA